jgi:hypothetical protein
MTAMRGIVRVIVATVAASFALALFGETFGLSGWSYLAGLLVVIVLVSLADRDAFYGGTHERGS